LWGAQNMGRVTTITKLRQMLAKQEKIGPSPALRRKFAGIGRGGHDHVNRLIRTRQFAAAENILSNWEKRDLDPARIAKFREQLKTARSQPAPVIVPSPRPSRKEPTARRVSGPSLS